MLWPVMHFLTPLGSSAAVPFRSLLWQPERHAAIFNISTSGAKQAESIESGP